MAQYLDPGTGQDTSGADPTQDGSQTPPGPGYTWDKINKVWLPPGSNINPETGQPYTGISWVNPDVPKPANVVPGYTVPGSPGATIPPPTGGGGGGGPAPAPGPAAGPGPSPFPTFTPPPYTPATPLQAPSNPYTFTPFTANTFNAPTLAEARNAPGYQFGLQQGQDALQNSAAARGTLRGGGTLKDLFNYTNAAAEQNYGNVFNQDLTAFNTNEGNRFGTWAANNAGNLGAFNTNYGVSKDVNTSLNQGNQQDYQNAYQNAAGAFNPLFQGSTLSFQDTFNRWLAKLNSLTSIATAGAS